MTFSIHHAKISDLPRIMDIYAFARKFMAEHGNPRQWGPTNWPSEDRIRKDIAEEKLYVCANATGIVGVFYFDYGHDIEPTYRNIDGHWIGDEDYGVVHRIASDGSVKGVGSFCIGWAFCRCRHLRMDTHPDNIVMQNLLMKLGFKECGIIHVVQDDEPRLAFEK